MSILLTGASGFVGKAVVSRLSKSGHRVVPLRRVPSVGSEAGPTWNPAAGQIRLEPAGPFDAVVHLAGENIAQRWTPTPAATRTQILARHSYLIMQTPTTAQLRTGIEVLTQLGERLNTHAQHSVMQLSESPLGAHYAGRIEVGTIEQTTRIEAVATQLSNWREELLEQREQCVSHHV